MEERCRNLTLSTIFDSEIRSTSTIGGTNLKSHSNIVDILCSCQGSHASALSITTLSHIVAYLRFDGKSWS